MAGEEEIDGDSALEELSASLMATNNIYRLAKRMRRSANPDAVLGLKSHMASKLLRAGRLLDDQVKRAVNERHGARWTTEEEDQLLAALKTSRTRDARHRLLACVPGRTDKSITEHVASMLLARMAKFGCSHEDLQKEFSLTQEELGRILDTGNEGRTRAGVPPGAPSQ